MMNEIALYNPNVFVNSLPFALEVCLSFFTIIIFFLLQFENKSTQYEREKEKKRERERQLRAGVYL
jgi:hypothetical protein